jgi:murein DD-endopeptidase MepM/ murein hydrolase activator NlpD
MTRLWSAAVVAMLCTVVPVSARIGPQTPAAITVTVASRALQPGEVVVLTISTPGALDSNANHLAVRAFDHNWIPFQTDANTWRVLMGIDLDLKPGTYPVVVTGGSSTASKITRDLVVVDKKFVTRTLTVDDAYVNPPESVQARIAEEAARLTKLWLTESPARLWTTPFTPPVPESPNSAFGSRSVFNGEARSPHSGADFPSAAGSTIKAPNAGQVVLAENLYFSGNTVIIDHGLGLYSQVAHLSEIGVKVGDRVTPGQTLGKVGATGRVTGPHLHWAVRLGGARVDPIALLAVAGEPKAK